MYNDFFWGDRFFQWFPALFFVLFFLILGIILYTIIRNLLTWNQNNHAPRLTVPATLVSKRTDVSYHSTPIGDNQGFSHSSSTWYYATFQVESGDRMEFSVSGKEYGMLAEGDKGQLSFQGTRYLSFARE